MTGRVLLHIGVMKSATSYLQGVCETNREALADKGLLWVGEELRYPAVRDLLGRGERRHEGGQWAVLARLMARHPGDVLLSNELIAAFGPRQVGRVVEALADRSLEVVVTSRDLAHIVPSQWQTTIKNGRTWRWADFAARVCADGPTSSTPEEVDPAGWFWRRHDLAAIVGRWTAVVPADSITVVTVPRAPTSEDTVASRFGSVVGVDLATLAGSDPPRNPSLGAHSVELVRRLNETMAEAEEVDRDHRYRRALGARLAAHAGLEPRFGLSERQREWLRERVLQMVAAVVTSGVRVVGDLADIVPEPAAGATDLSVDPAATTDAALVAAALRGYAGLAEDFESSQS